MKATLRKDSEICIRCLWPFARLLGTNPQTAQMLHDLGLNAAHFADPDTRLPHRSVMQILEWAVTSSGNPSIGLLAGEQAEPGDFDVLEYAARGAPNLGEAIQCLARYVKLMNSAAEVTLELTSQHAILRYRVTDGVPQPPAANDFVLASGVAFSRRNTAVDEPPVEVRFAHDPPGYAEAYSRVFRTRVRFGTGENAIVMTHGRLSVPMRRPDPAMSRVFERRARQLLSELRATTSTKGRVHEVVHRRLGRSEIGMSPVARELGMSTATLRRRLSDEGTTFSGVVDGARRSLAEAHLRSGTLSATEIAFLLGFSNVTAFYRAFRRWAGMSPAEFRAQGTPGARAEGAD